MAKFNGVVYLNEEQYETLRNTGTITVGDVTLSFDDDTLYVIPDTTKEQLQTIQNELTELKEDISDASIIYTSEEILNTSQLEPDSYYATPEPDVDEDDNKADKDLSNVTYPEIIYDSIEKKFDGVPHTGSADRVVMSYVSSDGLTWYRIWASGWKECGAIDSRPLSSYLKTITLPIEFTTANYHISITPDGHGGGEDNYSWWIYNAYNNVTTKSQFTVRMRSATPIIHYYCCGY